MAERKSEPTRDYVPDWQVIAGLRRSKLDEVTAEILDRQRQMKDLEAEVKDLKEQAVKLLVKADVKTVLVNGSRVTRVEGSRARLDKEKLVQAHGPKVLTWLQEATVYTPFTTLKITPPGEKGEKEDES